MQMQASLFRKLNILTSRQAREGHTELSRCPDPNCHPSAAPRQRRPQSLPHRLVLSGETSSQEGTECKESATLPIKHNNRAGSATNDYVCRTVVLVYPKRSGIPDQGMTLTGVQLRDGGLEHDIAHA